MRWLLAICIFVLSGCYVTTVRWPQPYLLPYKIHEKNSIGEKVGVLKINDRNFPVAQGRIYTKGNQLTGNTWIRPYITYGKGHRIYHEAMVEQVTKPWSEIDKTNIYDRAVFRIRYPSSVDSVTMQLPLPYHMGDTTTYISYRHESFLRRDLLRGSIAIYDLTEMDNHELSNYTDHFVMPRLFLLVNGADTTRIYKGSFYREQGVKRRMMKFIHDRYHVDKKVSDFKNTREILEFIIEEESVAKSH